jgi:uracil-DNA glycosylase family 4
MAVPNSFPTLPAAYRIAFVGEAPGRDEVSQGRPFVGASGRFFNQLLSKANLLREACFLGNVCQEQPENNVITRFDYDGDEIQHGLGQLTQDLQKYKPHLIVPLGNLALHAVKNAGHVLKKRRDKEGYKFVYPQSIDNWRGSKFLSPANSVLPSTKCLGSFHPAYCLRQYENTPYLMMDLIRAAKEGLTPTLTFPNRALDTDAPFDAIMSRLAYLHHVSPVSMDIEGYLWGMSCISIATNESASFCIPFFRKDGSSCWTEDQEMQILRALSALLADPNVHKIWQNGLYDRFVLQYGFHMPVLGNVDDTMLKFWEKYCELEKNLGVQASILTDEPFYKGDRKTQDDRTFYEYCCKDSAITFEINDRLTPLLAAHSPRALSHYRFNHSLLNLFLYCELRGIRYDSRKAQERLSEVNTFFYRLQAELDAIAGCGIPHTCVGKDLEAVVRHIACHKRDKTRALKEYESTLPIMLGLCRKPALTKEEYGFLDIQLGFDLNVKSPNLKHYLYTELKIPAKYNKDTGAETADGLAILKLSKQHPHPALDKVAEIAFLRTRTTFLNISADADERIRCGYNAVGTETGRITCYTSPTGSGYNLQTLPDEDNSFPPTHPLYNGMRDLVIADEGHYLFQCDLKGSDGWTVGAHLARLGDSTMLDDLKHGIKPAQRICYLLRHGVHSLNGKQRPEVLELLKEVKKRTGTTSLARWAFGVSAT